MTRKAPLRRRVTLAFMLLGFVLSTGLAIAVVAVAENYEHVLASEILRGQAEDYALRISNHLPTELPLTQRLSGYRADDPALPAAGRRPMPGIHEDPQNEGVHVGVFDTSAGRLVFLIDLSDIEKIESRFNFFLAGIVVCGTLLSALLGWLLAGSALKPIRLLAERVEELTVTPRLTHLAADASPDELGTLAKSIDDYQARLVAAEQREHTFLADASHELRTPISVIQGVVDVLGDDPSRPAGDRARLARLHRSAQEMRGLLEVMLSAARRTPAQSSEIESAPFLTEIALQAIAHAPAIKTTVAGTQRLYVPKVETTQLLHGLARRLVQHRQTGTLLLARVPEGILLRFDDGSTETTDPQPEAAPRADAGTGSALLDRLAHRIGATLVYTGNHQVMVRLPT